MGMIMSVQTGRVLIALWNTACPFLKTLGPNMIDVQLRTRPQKYD